MKKCDGCQMEIDKYTIACQYCGRLIDASKQPLDDAKAKPKGSPKKPRNDNQKS